MWRRGVALQAFAPSASAWRTQWKILKPETCFPSHLFFSQDKLIFFQDKLISRANFIKPERSTAVTWKFEILSFLMLQKYKIAWSQAFTLLLYSELWFQVKNQAQL